MSTVTLHATTPASETSSDRPQDLETTTVDRVLTALAVQPDKGSSSAEARERFAKYGPNAIVEKEISLARKILRHFTGPSAYMIEAAATISAVIGHWRGFWMTARPRWIQPRDR
jgi:H+-transporting ATPase